MSLILLGIISGLVFGIIDVLVMIPLKYENDCKRNEAMSAAGQVIGSSYFWKEALAGVLSKTIYLPFSAYTVNWLIKEQEI